VHKGFSILFPTPAWHLRLVRVELEDVPKITMSMKCNLKRLICRPFWAMCVLAGFLPAAQAVNLVQEFYLPMPESQLRQACLAVESGTGTNMDSIYSIVVSGNGTVIYYDQWEDGYEVDLSNPTQATTQIWGDGIDTNGITPGFAHDPVGIPAGTVITLTNTVSLPRNPSQILYDGRDRIAANKALVISRAGWPLPIGSVFGGAVVVPSTIDYDTNYVSPVGQDMTNHLFQYVGLFIMAAQNGTTVTIDTDGPGAAAPFTVSLNQGESYLVNGGVKKGGTVFATKPVQVNLVAGHINAHYAMDWFTLYPQSAWSDTYYTPVGSASGNPTYIYFYNPAASAITINYANRNGSGSFSVPAMNVFQYQMPQNSGASFTSVGGAKYTALCTVAANPSSDTAYNWGFTLLPQGGLTTEAVVGWGPGSSDGTQNGSPVWVTPLAGTRIYVDYKGDHAGPLTDPNGNKYDTNFDVVALQSKTIFDPSKNQTGMRLYTIDGTLISAAWGEDPTVAAPGNPYIDAGTPVLPFPVPTLKKTSAIINDLAPPGLSVGDTVQYTVEIDNKSLLPLGNTVVIDAPSANLAYVAGSTTLNGVPVPDSASGTAFPLDAPGYTIPVILHGGTSIFQYQATVAGSGSVSNTVSLSGFNLTVQNFIPVGVNSCNLNFTDSGGTSVATYAANSNVYVQLTDPGANSSPSTIQTVNVVVQNITRGDIENITLTETGINTGVFFNAGGLPSSVASGLSQQDGILNAAPGDLLSVTWNNPLFGNSCSANAIIQTSAFNKVLYLSANGSTNGVQALNRIDPVAYAHSPARNSVVLGVVGGGGSAATIGVDGSAFMATNSSVVNFNYATGSGTNRLMLVSVGVDNTVAASSVSYNGVNLTLVASTPSNGNKNKIYVYGLTNPPTGTYSVAVSLASAINVVVGVNTFSNVNQTTPLGTPVAATLNSVTVATATNGLVFGAISSDGAIADTSGQTDFWNTNASAAVYAAGSQKAAGGATSIAMSWSGGAHSGSVGVAINPALTGGSGGGGTNVTVFTQTPIFCSGFTLPGGSVIAITNFVSITSGSMPTNPAITASLKYGTNNFIMLANAAYNAANSNLVWMGALTNAVTVPAGQAIDFVISNAQSGVSYVIDFDSAATPSKIILPTTTIINVNSVGAYDAPYPNGNPVVNGANGTTLYVRTVVSDPFGSHDITSLNLGIDGPGTNADLTVTLTNTVADDGCAKTFEYAWQTTATVGNYGVSATANEGTEGINTTAATGVNLQFTDTGTPSSTTLTSGNNGSATNSFPANQSICVRVVDLDQNLSPTTVDQIPVTVTSGSGDSELIVLTETDTNSGIFTGCVTASSTTGAGSDNGTLYAPVGSVITASYADPTDPNDQSSATATIQVPANTPGVQVTKTLVSPANSQAGIGQTVQFNLQVINTGNTVLTNLSLADNFPSASLTFQSASATPDNVTGSSLAWTNLGSFAAGQVTNITVSFTAASSASATNFATAVSVGGATNTGNASLTITRAAMTITKTVLSPTNGILNIGSNVVFRIVVKNTGQTTITSLPLEDTYSASQFQYLSATNPPDGVGAGDLLWNNLGPLATNANVTVDVLMKVTGAGSPAINTAASDYAVDSGGNPVPATSGTVGVTNASAKISGNVYNDLDQSGTLTPGDVGLEGVSLALYTDPNGDGNPADGALVQLTTTDSSGYYELLNLPLGNYVIVETPLPGFANGTPANGRLPVVLTSLTTNANNSFFDYQPVVTSYATIGGTVWNDTNASGIYVSGDVGIPNVQIDLIQDLNTNGLVDAGEPVSQSTLTAADGSYSFAGVVPGNYVIQETDLASYSSTGDIRPPNDNQIGLLVASGAVTNGNDFFDIFVGAPYTNRPPVAVDDVASTPVNVSVTVPVLANDIDPDGDALTIISVSPTNGTAIIAGTNVVFHPATNFIGTATAGYTITDGKGGTNSALIIINVTNRPPVALNDAASTPVNTSVTIPVLANDSDPDGQALSIVNVSPTNGTASITGTNVLFNPATNFIGTATIGYTISDGNGGTNSALIIINVTNRPPVAGNDSTSTPENVPVTIPVLANDSDPDGQVLTIVDVSPTNGSASISGTNIVFNPATNFVGTATAGYTITDGNGGTNSALVSISVTNRPPLANPDSFSMAENTTNTFAPLMNDSAQTPGGSLTIIAVNPTNGTAGVSGTNIIFIPIPNFLGVATVGYTIIDNVGGTNRSVMSITVTNVPPFANPDNYSVRQNSTNTLSPLVNDTVQTPGGSLTIISVNPTNGTASINGTNVIFTPKTNFLGTATIGYKIIDNVGGTNTGLITLLVTNAPPLANPDSYTVLENSTNTLSPLVNDSVQTSGGSLGIVSVSPTNGAASINGTNIIFIPSTNFVGPATIGYTITDNIGGTNSSVITVTVTAVTLMADIAILKTGPASGVAGSNLTYTITATNLGPATATNVVVTDLLPAGFTFVSATPATATVSNNAVSWPGSSLTNKARSTFTVTVVAADGGNFTNIAFATTGTSDPNPANNDGSSTNSQVRTTVSSLADVAIFKTGATNVFAGASLTYIIVATNSGPSAATNVIIQDKLPATGVFQSASAGYSLSNGLVTWPSMTLAKGATTNLTVVMAAPASGAFTNIAFSTAATADPNPTNNDGSAAGARVSTSVTPSADLIVLLSGPANVNAGDNFTYTVVVTNGGLSTAASVVAKDNLPAGLSFISASGGGALSNNVITWPTIASFANGGTTNYIITVSAPGLGQFTNVAFATSTTFDPNPANNDGTSLASQVQTAVASAQFGLLAGTAVFNPQTGLFEEQVIVTNIGATTVAGVRLYVGGLRSGVTLYNATGTTNGTPYVEYDASLNPGNIVTFALEFYDVNRLAFTSTLTVVAILPSSLPSAGTNGVAVTTEFMDTRIAGDPRFVIEFQTIPGKAYTILYSTNMNAAVWNIATPSVTANANVTQWYDDGPPKTDSKPATVGSRFYRVIQD
jgi:uncharacterized repeat protein (TIGR01451 family)